MKNDPSAGMYKYSLDSQAQEVNSEDYGQKAAGLSVMPALWRPPSIFLHRSLHEDFSSIASRNLLDQAVDLLVECLPDQLVFKFSEDLRGACERRGIRYRGRFLLRTSGPDEGIDMRGLLTSIECADDPASVRATLIKIWEEATRSGEHRAIAVVIQPMLVASAEGHLSNERRVARRNDIWLCEANVKGRQLLERFTPKPGVADDQMPLVAPDESLLFENLWRVARYYSQASRRLHLEWIWADEILFLVQLDPEVAIEGAAPASAWASSPPLAASSRFEVVGLASDAEPTSQKLLVQREYAELGLPTATLYVIHGSDLVSSKTNDTGFLELLRRDLGIMVKGGVVARTDIDGDAQFMLPRTSTVLSVEVLEGFFSDVVERMESERVDPASWRVLLHRFIPAQACAWAYADPTTDRVRIDSTWGVPEGLAWGSHDSFEVQSSTGEVAKRSIRYKEGYLDVGPDGDWFPKRAGAPWDWKSSATDAQLARIAHGTFALAVRENCPTHAMWFLGIRPNSGHPDCLPWFHHTNDLNMELTPSIDGRVIENVVRSREELRRVELLANHGEIEPGCCIEVIPNSDLIRDKGFVSLLASVAQRFGLIVVLNGSPLSHPYYILRRAGVNVTCRDLMSDDPGRVLRFGKLVRDQIPEIIESRGEDVETREAPPEFALDLLKQKLIEEALEVRSARGLPSLVGEMADVLEVLYGMCSTLGTDLENVISVAAAKRARRGGFEKGIFLVSTQDRPVVGRSRLGEENRKTSSGPRIEQSSLFPEYGDAGQFEGNLPVLRSNRVVEVPIVPPVRLSRLSPIYEFRIDGISSTIAVSYGEKSIKIAFLGEIESPPVEQLRLDLDE
ncbi:nucleoside triphosphate pyrophosphohydrolase [Lentzea flaviverrucosa]|uniref:Predicted house-cleaning noncanonical NTP pyrophosphatase, all-alpha NTP-PPase (MazG) superfamily n=1 Tax=Lentzea flaviverrucosa TaxID=200379 RepID=A0A1H9Q375_9PSEU|nr:nucleoside triphosphate pyrophosphohydrolase [Lentzea flaviverrucosa]RDI29655.1 putative house-cleaning noncanonical NTP pyrophosphatase (MazG superfamily) [Lentzea flaviverrucosa]SER54323.1 Predicted house-cleaning noncanonical NTP pyrophosphatase, all-alpha NTP-PPase (MazG) superfamily [Lentzea flaviverrucosa]